MKRIVLFGGLAGVALLGASGYGWHAWTTSPSYSLKRISAALEMHDRYEFEKHVDIDGVIQSYLADAAEGNALASALGGAVVGQLKQQLIKAVEEGGVPTDSQFGRAFHGTFNSSKLPQIDRQGRNAYFSVDTTTKGGAPFALKVHLTQVPDGYWRLDRLANVKELRAAEELEEKLRKAAIAQANDEKLGKLVVVAKLHTSHREGYGGWQRKNRFQIRFENTDNKKIAGFSGHIRFPSQRYEQGIKGTLDLAPGATDNGTWSTDVNQFIEPTEAVFALGETDRFDVEIESIAYSDGTKVARGDSE